MREGSRPRGSRTDAECPARPSRPPLRAAGALGRFPPRTAPRVAPAQPASSSRPCSRHLYPWAQGVCVCVWGALSSDPQEGPRAQPLPGCSLTPLLASDRGARAGPRNGPRGAGGSRFPRNVLLSTRWEGARSRSPEPGPHSPPRGSRLPTRPTRWGVGCQPVQQGEFTGVTSGKFWPVVLALSFMRAPPRTQD